MNTKKLKSGITADKGKGYDHQTIDFNSEEFEKDFYYEDNDLGAVYFKEKTIFKVWAPTAERVVLNLYTTGSDEESGAKRIGSFEMISGGISEKGVHVLEKEGDWNGIYYTYGVTVNGEEQETGDVYAKACGVNGMRSMVVDLEETNPEGFKEDKHVIHPLEDTQIWEVHIGDFSNAPSSGIKEEHRGKYLAFTDINSTLNKDGVHPTGISYLKDLGVTHIHLLPAFDFGSIDEREEGGFNWGYDPVNYNVPEGSYSTDAFHGQVRIKEFKEMVMALHQAGISVVMDVVYNHTHSVHSNFNRTVPGYYYRKEKDGTWSNGSGCGNDTASDRKMFRKYMVDSILYWMREYHIDGFRFDLMGLHDVETMNTIRKAVNEGDEYGKDMLIYGEPWAAGSSSFRTGARPAVKASVNLLEDGILMFNDDTRDAIKGPFDILKEDGFVNGKGTKKKKEDIKRVICGMFSKKWKDQPSSPAKVINYVSAHDNSTLWDKLSDSVNRDGNYKEKNENLLAMNKLAAAIVQFSKGVPFMQAGEEAGRTKFGEDNSYNLSKEVNWLDWERMYEFQDLIQYYKGLMKVRGSLPQIKNLTRESIKKIRFMDESPAGVVGYMIDDLLVIFNASSKKYVLAFQGEYDVLVNKEESNPKGIKVVRNCIAVSEKSACVMKKKDICDSSAVQN